MKKYFISFGNGKSKNQLNRVCNEAKKTGWFDDVVAYTPSTIAVWAHRLLSGVCTHPDVSMEPCAHYHARVQAHLTIVYIHIMISHDMCNTPTILRMQHFRHDQPKH